MSRYNEMERKRELNEVHLLRGVAALMVCLFHLVLGNVSLFSATNIIERVCTFGYLGVEIFFILSGYVICYSLPANFSRQHYRTFFLKRIVRIEPPYLASIVLVLILNTLSLTYSGKGYSIDWLALVGHLAYINSFDTSTYLNVVYWTLGIEFQFYLLLALVFPLLRRNMTGFFSVMAAFFCLSFISNTKNTALIFPYLSYFGVGIVLFSFKYQKFVPKIIIGFLLFLFVVHIYFTKGLPNLIATMCTVVVIIGITTSNAVIKFFACISYSLYLTHVPVGGKVINLGLRFVTTDLERYLLVLIALTTSVLFAYLFSRLVEQPAIQWAKRFSYRRAELSKTNKTVSTAS